MTSGISTTIGLRERKKLQTRESISNAATLLFARRGFEQTTIAEVARAADVSKMTVTNYFPLKEDLVFDRHEAITGMLAEAVVSRTAGTSVLAAVRAAYGAGLDRRDPTFGFLGVQFARLVEGSTALRRRESEIFVAQEARLADTLVAEFASTPADVTLRIAAACLAGVVRVLYREGRRRLLAEQRTADIVRALRRNASAAFDALESGLPDAMVRP